MLVTSRRSLILGMGSLIAAPSLVKASSLMHLRGYDMDPWIWVFRNKDYLMPYAVGKISQLSQLNSVTRNGLSVSRITGWIKYNSHLEYCKIRESDYFAGNANIPHVGEYPLQEINRVIERELDRIT